MRQTSHKLIHRTLAAAFLLGLAAPALADDALPPSLRAAVSVTGPQIRVGDLFAHAGSHAGEIVAAAPAPGSRTVFDASWLAAMAQSHGLDWQPPNPDASVEISRDATVLDQDEICRQILARLGTGQDGQRIMLDGQVQLYVPVGGATDIAIDHVRMIPATGRFSLDLRAPADDPDAQVVPVSGRLQSVIEAPTLARPVMPGDVIAATDIIWTPMEIGQIPPGDIMDARDLIGHTPRRPLRPEELLRAIDIEMPIVIHRNDAVLIVLQSPGMTLTTQGRATRDGGQGETIPVLNTQSNRMIDAVVIGSGEVAVALPGELPTALAAIN